jgi:4-amino-4-deoxy-L-arabinose transferase-like glycosyltransferase
VATNWKDFAHLLEEKQRLVLVGIIILAMILRFHGFFSWHGPSGDEGNLTWDEVVYIDTGLLLYRNISDYSPASLFDLHEKSGKDVSSVHYLKSHTLFPHPPLVPYTISFFYHVFSVSIPNAFKVSVILGLLTILATFYIGRILFGFNVGFLAALFLTIDTTHWNCSQRIWLDGPLTAFFYTGLLFFILGMKKNRYLALSGFFFGLGLLTKYHAILALGTVILFTIIAKRDLILKKEFWILFLVCFAVFSPWAVWVQKSYGEPITEIPSVKGGLNAPFRMIKEILTEKNPPKETETAVIFTSEVNFTTKYSPKIEKLKPAPASPQKEGSVVTLNCSASDINGDPIAYRYYLLGPGTNNELAPISDWTLSNTFSWQTGREDIGPNIFGCTVMDNDGIYEYPQWLIDDHKVVGPFIIKKRFISYLIEGFSWTHKPMTGWIVGLFKDQGKYYYFGKLIEYSPLFIFAFLSIGLLFYERREEDLLLILTAALVIGYRTFIPGDGYESRYILPAIPALLLLSARTQLWIWDKLDGKKYARGAFLLLIVYLIARGFKIAYYLSVSVNAAYF